MRSNRGSSADPSRADAAARRLALLAADLGAADPQPRSEEWPPAADDYTRVVPSRRPPPPVPEPPPEPCPPVAAPPALPRPGRHAARRRWAGITPHLPELGAAQLTVVAVIVAAGVAFGAWWVVRDQAAPAESVAPQQPASVAPLATGATSSSGPGATEGTVTVDVTGKVRRPGIVVLDSGARVVDALEAAGGERNGVDLSTLNLARVLVDGEQIVVGTATVAAPGPGTPVAPGGAAPSGAPPVLVNLNTASQVELETLPDVGPVTALAILAWRDEHGGFTSVDELLEVDGIGEVTLDKLGPYVTV